jgi:hypothetical protein
MKLILPTSLCLLVLIFLAPTAEGVRTPSGGGNGLIQSSLPQSTVIGRSKASFTGEVKAGDAFERPFGPGFLFRLEPSEPGWTIVIHEKGREEDLSRLTPPLHGVPNPRDIEGWHFRNADNTGPNEPGEKNVKAPGDLREFVFSPEVGRSIDGPNAMAGPTPEQIGKVRSYGQGILKILGSRLGNLEPGKRACMEWMRFEVSLSWLPAR